MRSKWSDDDKSDKDDQKTKQAKTADDPTLEGRLGKMLQQQLTTPAKENKANPEGAENVMLQEFSPKFTFG